MNVLVEMYGLIKFKTKGFEIMKIDITVEKGEILL